MERRGRACRTRWKGAASHTELGREDLPPGKEASADREKKGRQSDEGREESGTHQPQLEKERKGVSRSDKSPGAGERFSITIADLGGRKVVFMGEGVRGSVLIRDFKKEKEI